MSQMKAEGECECAEDCEGTRSDNAAVHSCCISEGEVCPKDAMNAGSTRFREAFIVKCDLAARALQSEQQLATAAVGFYTISSRRPEDDVWEKHRDKFTVQEEWNRVTSRYITMDK
jgi:hypothetical protein